MYRLSKKDLERSGLRLINTHKPGDFGPISYINPNYLKKFKNFIYACVQPKESKLIKLYKLENFCKKCSNSFWTMDENLCKTLNSINSSENKEIDFMYIPECFRFFIGQVSLDKYNINLDEFNHLFLVFIPEQYVNILIEAQTASQAEKLSLLENCLIVQKNFYDNFTNKLNEINEKYLEKYLSLDRAKKLAVKGNNVQNIPNSLRNVLKCISKDTLSIMINEKLPKETFELHHEVVHLPDGRDIDFVLKIHASYEGYYVNKSKTILKETTDVFHKYTIVFDWC